MDWQPKWWHETHRKHRKIVDVPGYPLSWLMLCPFRTARHTSPFLANIWCHLVVHLVEKVRVSSPISWRRCCFWFTILFTKMSFCLSNCLSLFRWYFFTPLYSCIFLLPGESHRLSIVTCMMHHYVFPICLSWSLKVSYSHDSMVQAFFLCNITYADHEKFRFMKYSVI